MRDEAYLTIGELQLMVDLAAERLFDLQRDWLALQEQLVRAYAMVGTLAAPVDSHAGDGIWTDQPAGDNIWGDQTST